MKIKYGIPFIVGFFLMVAYDQYFHNIHAEETKLTCMNKNEMEKFLNDKGFQLLLNMSPRENNPDGIIESLWVGGTNAVISASNKDSDKSCFLTFFDNVIFNPFTIEEIFNAYKKI